MQPRLGKAAASAEVSRATRDPSARIRSMRLLASSGSVSCRGALTVGCASFAWATSSRYWISFGESTTPAPSSAWNRLTMACMRTRELLREDAGGLAMGARSWAWTSGVDRHLRQGTAGHLDAPSHLAEPRTRRPSEHPQRMENCCKFWGEEARKE
ncbi:hypothetical protein C8R46DRAFT_1097230 [Mycena filopes]|nr:hypothetical protein C8R46DRAFT_1097230 [Mycena filopes]